MIHDSWFMIKGYFWFRVHGSRFRVHVMVEMALVDKINELIENEGKSCSYDPELITPEYVYRMWGGAVAIEDIATAMDDVKV